MNRRENALRDEQWRIDQKNQDHQRCLGNPRTCGVGIWRAGIRMAAWDRTGGKVIQQPYTKRYRAFQSNQDSFSHHTREVRPHRSEKDGWDDSTKTRKEMTTMLFGQAYTDRQMRAGAVSNELAQIKTQREGAIMEHNAEQMALIDKEFKRVEREKEAHAKRVTRKLQARGDHPEYSTTRPPPKRHKSGARAKFVPRKTRR